MSRRARLGLGVSGAASAVLLAAFSAPLRAPRAAAPAVTATPRSTGTAVGQQPTQPRLTLLYQNFPNPFPTALASETCLWFDLHRTSRVRLTIHGIRGNLVRTIVPSAQLTGELVAGRYGRGTPGSAPNCDPRFAWDGRADDGRVVPPGVYLVRLRTDFQESFKRILFRGR